MIQLLAFIGLWAIALPRVLASCIVFDADFNLLAFGLKGKDYNAGREDSWTGTHKAVDITTDGRPAFDTSSPQCYLAQFFNSIYVLGADSAHPSAVHIYNVAARSWSRQSVNTGAFDPKSYNAILDHDTNVFYALSHGEVFFLNMAEMRSATDQQLSWATAGKAPFPGDYKPVMGLAQNHIHFLNLPGSEPGTAEIFVIHYSYFQPQPQAYTPTSGKPFPNSPGKVTSFFKSDGAQQEFAFIPSDGSATYVINVQSNTTHTLPPPSSNDPSANYAASITSLVQLDTTGAISFVPYKPDDNKASASASWSPVKPLAAAAPPSAKIIGGNGKNNTSGGNGDTSPTSGGIRLIPTGYATLLLLLFCF